MTFEGLVEIFKGDFADKCNEKILLVSMVRGDLKGINLRIIQSRASIFAFSEKKNLIGESNLIHTITMAVVRQHLFRGM